MFHGFTHNPIQAEQEEIIRVAVVGADTDALGVGAEFGDSLDRERQRMPRGGSGRDRTRRC